MINLIPLKDTYNIYQLGQFSEIPQQVFESGFYSITKTEDEISVITNCNADFDNLKSEKDWSGFKVEGMLDFSLVGIINDITKPLKDNNISVFVISTFNTDYIFVKKESFQRAIEIFDEVDFIKVIVIPIG